MSEVIRKYFVHADQSLTALIIKQHEHSAKVHKDFLKMLTDTYKAVGFKFADNGAPTHIHINKTDFGDVLSEHTYFTSVVVSDDVVGLVPDEKTQEGYNLKELMSQTSPKSFDEIAYLKLPGTLNTDLDNDLQREIFGSEVATSKTYGFRLLLSIPEVAGYEYAVPSSLTEITESVYNNPTSEASWQVEEN